MGPLRTAVAATCRALGPRLSLPTADAVAAVADHVAATPSMVVAGPVSSGKSTLVNALVGRRVAPTGAGECTRLVAHYVRGPVDRLDVVLVDGTRRPLPLAPGGRVPAAVGDRLGVDPEDVDHLVVTLTSAALDGLTVVDTPGTGSVRGLRGRAGWGGRGQVGSRDATVADAALVVLPATAHPGDLEPLPDPARHGPAGVVAVLGRADTVGGAAPAGVAAPGAEVAVGLGRRLGDRVGPVLPVVGLLAETAVTGALRGEDVRALRALATADRDTLGLALLDPELFTTTALPVPTAVRVRLLDLLDLRGVGLGVALLRADPDAGVGEVCDALLAASGLDRLVARLDDEVRARTDLLAAVAGLRRLDVLATALARPADDGGRPEEGERIRDAVAELRTRPAFHELALLEVRARLRGGSVRMPGELTDEVVRLAEPAPVGRRLGREDATRVELAGHAARRAAWWRSYATWGTPRALGRVAHVVHRAYVLLWRELTA